MRKGSPSVTEPQTLWVRALGEVTASLPALDRPVFLEDVPQTAYSLDDASLIVDATAALSEHLPEEARRRAHRGPDVPRRRREAA
jgi:hypothetical protein